MEPKISYFITCFENLPSENKIHMGSSRCFGYYNSFEEADEAVKENRCDLHEYLYKYCLVEAITPGIHQICLVEDRHFYEFDTHKGCWEPKPEPECLARIINFAIG